MDLITILLISIGLAMDAFAVSVASGSVIRKLNLRRLLVLPLSFGFFQAFMPIVGWLAGVGFSSLLDGWDHWIAFVLLSAVGIKMIYESLFLEKDPEPACSIKMITVLILSVATSIDALAVGLSFSFLGVHIVYPAAVIGIVTFILSIAGVLIGKRLGHIFESRIEIIGGLILIGIGIKILLSHIMP